MKWDFEITKYYEILEEHSLTHFGFRVFSIAGLLEKFSIPDNNFYLLLESI